MIYITIDIETVAEDINSINELEKKKYDELKTEEEKIEFLNLLPLNPFASFISCIGIKKCIDKEHDKGYILINTDEEIESDTDDYKFVCLDEKTMLEKFWIFLKKQKEPFKLITFNGREFDFPYIMIRSALLEIEIPIDLMQGSDWTMDSYHIDIAKKLIFNKYSGNGPLKKRSLEYYTMQFLGKSSKTELVKGCKVSELYKNGNVKGIADYNIEDLDVTFELFIHLNKLRLI